MTRTSPTWLTALVALALASAAASFADVVHLNDGSTLEGQVVGENGDRVVVRTAAGTTVVVPRPEVTRVERGMSVEEQHRARLRKVDPRDPEARYALGQWLKSVRRRDLARREFLAVLLVEPDHRFARAELGQVRQEGRWVEAEPAATSSPSLPSQAGGMASRLERAGPASEVSELLVENLGCSPELAAALVELRGREKARARAARAILQDLRGEEERLAAALSASGAATDRAWRGILRARGESFLEIPCDAAAIREIAREHVARHVAPALATIAPDLR